MLPTNSFPKPSNFNSTVYDPGDRFLKKCPVPTNTEWSSHNFWTNCLPEMSILYNRICSYCSTWIPHSTGNHSIDHFVPKTINPSLAYTWSNFRYVSSRFNSRKGRRNIIDPFIVEPDTFIIDFTTFMIHPNSSITDPDLLKLVSDTIKYLKFNSDDDLVNERFKYFIDYKNGIISFKYLEKISPFIASELIRQNKVT